MRTFIAVNIKPEVALLKTVANLKKDLSGESLKWVDERSLHLTLKFLGETSEEQVEKVKIFLGAFAKKQPQFNFRLSGMNYFKSRGIPKVLFVPILNGEALSEMAAGIDARLFQSGIEKEDRKFNPHLTLARIKNLFDRKKFYEAVDKYKNMEFQSVDINEIIFYQSYLKPKGPYYTELAKFNLSGID